MMPAGVLSALRSQAALRRLDRDCEIIPVVRTEDVSGGSTEAYGTPLAAKMGLESGIGGQQDLEQRILDKIGNDPFFYVLLNAGTVVDEDYVIRQTTPVVRLFRIVGVPNKGITHELMRRVVVVEDNEIDL